MRVVLLYLLAFLTISSKSLLAQANENTLTEDQFLWYVKKFHPIAMLSNLVVSNANSNLLKSRGNFDPYAYGDLSQKNFDEKNYYHLLESGLKIPTWYGVELKANYQDARGFYLNPENKLPNNGLWQAGITVPLGQGLFIDERRAVLKKAKILQSASLAEQEIMLNDLFFESSKHYWKWVIDWNKLKVYDEAVNIAQERFIAVKESYLQGDKPAIDTLEAYIQVQTRIIERNQLKLDYQKTTLELSNYLWFENNIPLEISDSLTPPLYQELIIEPEIDAEEFQNRLQNARINHPNLKAYSFKESILQLNRKLKVEKLKPKINVNYNLLSEPNTTLSRTDYALNNNKWGAHISFPILLRQQRGELQQANIKLKENDYQLSLKQLEIENKMRAYYNEQIILKQQYGLYLSATSNYSKLLRGERTKFNSGESTLFIINSRELKLLDTKIKFLESIAKYQIAKNGLLWAAGILYK